MRLTKQQIGIIDAMNNGGYIWMAANMPYLARINGAGYKSSVINRKTFSALVENNVLARDTDHPNRWILKGS